jgi:hypothetical protein
MLLPTEICQACRRNPMEVLVEDDDPLQPYRVCRDCAQRLDSLSLRPLEWFNLAALHGPAKFLLHDDFYFHNGIAYQPQVDVEEPEKYPAPTLDQVEEDQERLLDYAMTLYFLDEPTVAALSRHDKEAVLSSLQRRLASSPNFDIEACAYEICAEVIGTVAENWIRERWSGWNAAVFLSLAAATAKCLPFEEGFGRVAEVFENEKSLLRLQRELHDLNLSCHAFTAFHSRRTLDWMEAHPALVTHQNWGRVAAQSHFSWSRAVAWLDRGRPLSHIALFAIHSCFCYDTLALREKRPKLEEAIPVGAMLQRLEAYYEIDPVPRVRNLALSIREQMLDETE